MRQPAVDPAPALRSLIAALPDDRLRAFVLDMLLAGLTAKAPTGRRLERLTDGQERPAEPPKRHRGRPRGRPRGPRKAAPGAAPKLAQRQRDAERKREKRAAARAARQANSPSKTGVNAVAPDGSNGTEAAAAKLWQHAERLVPQSAVARHRARVRHQ